MGDGSEFAAQAARGWIAAVNAKMACIKPSFPWEKGYSESSRPGSVMNF